MLTRGRSDFTYATVEPIARAARSINAVLGVWLFLSSFLFVRQPMLALHDALVGTAVFALSVGALYIRRELHIPNVALAAWLFASAFLLHGRSAGMIANDMVVGALVFGFASVGDGDHDPPMGEFH